VKAYKKLNDSGHIVSVEVWNNTDLVGGIYAVKSKNYLSAESMFFKETDAGKAAFVKLVQVLKQQNHTWMDLQMVTNVSRSFGGREIPRKQFLEMIKSNPV
jgi:leucyl/phenylalanyl-tRNA--protein transferase